MTVDTLRSFKVFRKVIEAGNFVAAAERLELSAAMVSEHVMHVELFGAAPPGYPIGVPDALRALRGP